MVRQLRNTDKKTGLILANGGWLTYQHVVCLSSEPRSSPYPQSSELPEVITDIPVPEMEISPDGEAVVEVDTCAQTILHRLTAIRHTLWNLTKTARHYVATLLVV